MRMDVRMYTWVGGCCCCCWAGGWAIEDEGCHSFEDRWVLIHFSALLRSCGRDFSAGSTAHGEIEPEFSFFGDSIDFGVEIHTELLAASVGF